MEHRDEKLVIEPIIYDNQDDNITPDRLSTRNTRQSSFVPNGTSFIIQGTGVSLTVVNSLPVQAPPSLSRAYEILDELHTSSSRVETSILSPPARVSPVDISPTFPPPSSQLRIPLCFIFVITTLGRKIRFSKTSFAPFSNPFCIFSVY